MKIPILNLYLYRKLKEVANGGGGYLTNFKVMEVMQRNLYQVPRIIYYCVLKEMEEYKLIVKIDRKTWKLLITNKDKILNNCTNLLID